MKVIVLGLEGKVALVTGAAGGIGSAVVEILSAAGARVQAVDLPTRPVPGAESFHPCDVTDLEQIDLTIQRIAQRHGRLDVVVHSSGITRDAVLWKLSVDSWRQVLAVNLDSAFYLLRACTPLLRQHGGSVVLVTSINGERGKFGQANYAASKAGLIGLMKTAAKELGRFGVRVNCVSPGLVQTAMTASLPAEVLETARCETALGRLGVPADVAGTVLFLCSELSRHVTGQVLRVDGGQHIG